MAVRDYFFKRVEQQIEPSVDVWDSHSVKDHGVVDYSKKEDRSEQVTYEALGKNLYSTGLPPSAFYTNPLNAFVSFPIVYSALTAISDAGAGMDIKVYEVKEGTETEVPNHPYYSLFKSPNPFEGSFEFLERILLNLDIYGNCFISKEKVAGGFELYILNPLYVGIIPDPKLKIKQYNYYINGQSVAYKPEEIIHLKTPNPSDNYFGLPPLACATNILTFEKNRLSFANAYFLNGAIPVGVIESDQNLSDQTLKLIRGSWENLHKGVTNSHKVAILQGGLKYKPITAALKDLDFSGLKKMSRDDVLGIYKIPSSILGDQSGTGASEGKSAITSFWRACVLPRLKRVESGLNRGLKVEIFGNGNYIFKFDLTNITALQDSKTDTAQYLTTMVSGSVFTINEARMDAGKPALADPLCDQVLISNSAFGNALMPVSEVGNQGGGTTTPKPGALPSNTPTVKPTPAKPAAKPAAKPVAKP